MASSFASSKWRRLAGAAAVVLLSAMQTTVRGGQPILFSSPDNDSASTNIPALTPQAPIVTPFDGSSLLPHLDANGPSPALPPPVPAEPTISPGEAQQLQTLLDKRQNWTMLTPAEILNVPTTDKILGVQDYGADGQPKNESVVERYYERLGRRSSSRTNAPAGNNSAQTSDFLGSQTSHWTARWSPPLLNPPDNSLAKLAGINASPSADANNNAGYRPTPDSPWSKMFSPPASQAASRTPVQSAMTGEFQQLLRPRQWSPTAYPASANTKYPYSSPSASAPDSLFGKTLLNPLGTPQAPSSGTVGTAIGVAPLPGLLGPTNAPPVNLNPSWKPELPPWMSSTPQPGVVPRRKF